MYILRFQTTCVITRERTKWLPTAEYDVRSQLVWPKHAGTPKVRDFQDLPDSPCYLRLPDVMLLFLPALHLRERHLVPGGWNNMQFA
jgi:hypothetical protein